MDQPEVSTTDLDAMSRHERRIRSTDKDASVQEKSTQTSSSVDVVDETPDPQPDDTWIAVMGMTGVGKSTLISLLVGHDIGVGHELQSMTRHMGLYRCSDIFKRTIWFVDTPGFDDTFRSDVEVLQEIATFFAELYDHNIRFSGILYLHRISDPRMGGSAVKNLELFKAMCGVRAFPIVRLVTTRWNLLKDDKERVEAVQRETELINNEQFFKPLLDNGARLMRYENLDGASTKALVKPLLYPEQKIDLSIQFEMVTQRRRLDKTNAGRYLGHNQASEKHRYESELRDLEDSMEEALKERDKSAMEEIAAERREFLTKREKLKRDQEEMMVDFAYLQRREIREFATTVTSKHTTDHRHQDSKHTSGRHSVEDFPPPPKRHTMSSINSQSGGSETSENTYSKTTVTRYYALEEGTLRGRSRGSSSHNQIMKIRRWLLKTLT